MRDHGGERGLGTAASRDIAPARPTTLHGDAQGSAPEARDTSPPDAVLRRHVSHVQAELARHRADRMRLRAGLESRRPEYLDVVGQLGGLRGDLEWLRGHYVKLKKTRSWKLTAPLRTAAAILTRLKVLPGIPTRERESAITDGLDRLAARLREVEAPLKADLEAFLAFDEDARRYLASGPGCDPAAFGADGRRPLLVLVTHDCSLSGAPVVVQNMAEALVADGAVEVVIFAKAGGHLAGDFDKLCRFRILPAENAAAAFAAELDAFADRPVKAAICNTIVTSELAPVLREHGFPVVSLVHEMPTVIEHYGAETFRTLDRSADAIVFGAAYVRDALVREYAPSNPNLFIVPTGYPDRELTQEMIAECRARLRAEAGFPDDSLVVIGCGTVEHRKGVDLFIQVAQHVARHPGGEKVRFVWIGWGVFPYDRYCESDIAKMGLADRVKLLGLRLDLPSYMPGADLFLLTSREDPFPLVNLAAMSAGIPPLVFEGAGGAASILGEGAGVVVPYLDVDAMGEAVLALAGDEARRTEIGRTARRQFQERYTVESFLGGIGRILRTHVGVPFEALEDLERRKAASRSAPAPTG